MDTALPDISRLTALPETTWQDLGEQFRRAGFDAQYLESAWQRTMRDYPVSLQRAILVWQVRRRHDLLGYGFRMFMLRDPVSDLEAIEVLGQRLLEDLLYVGMLTRPEPGQVVSLFDLRVFRGLLILCDDLSQRGEAVFGAGPGSAAFCGPSPGRGIVSNALDLGCGAGAPALWLSRHAHHVVATDINPRALAFLKINAAMNRIANVEGRLGNLFEAVNGEAFDFIVSQPPCIPCAPGLRPATYLFGGPDGNEMVRQILAELPRRLSGDGRAMVVYDRPMMADTNGDQHIEEADCNRDLYSLLVLGGEVNADAFSIRHSAPELRRGIDAFDSTVTSMREHLSAVGIRGFCPAICVLEHASNAQGWIETVRTDDTLWGEISTATIDRLLAGYKFLHRGIQSIQPGGIRIPEGSLVVRPANSNGSAAEKVHLGLPRGYLFPSLELTQQEWELLEASHKGKTLGATPELVAKAARAGLFT